jgi:hypothetical protein
LNEAKHTPDGERRRNLLERALTLATTAEMVERGSAEVSTAA